MPAEGLNLSSVTVAYDDLVTTSASQQCASTFLIVPGDIAASYLINKLTGSGMCIGTAMPKGTPTPLDPADIDTIRAWIASGAAP